MSNKKKDKLLPKSVHLSRPLYSFIMQPEATVFPVLYPDVTFFSPAKRKKKVKCSAPSDMFALNVLLLLCTAGRAEVGVSVRDYCRCVAFTVGVYSAVYLDVHAPLSLPLSPSVSLSLSRSVLVVSVLRRSRLVMFLSFCFFFFFLLL